jgi:hypothetical protein
VGTARSFVLLERGEYTSCFISNPEIPAKVGPKGIIQRALHKELERIKSAAPQDKTTYINKKATGQKPAAVETPIGISK